MTSQISIVNEMLTQFPTVTFCDNNPFNTMDAREFMQNIAILNKLNDSDILFKLAKLKASSKKIIDNDRMSFLTSIKTRFSYKANVCSNDFHWYWSYEYGNCYQFNLGFYAFNNKIDLLNVAREGGFLL